MRIKKFVRKVGSVLAGTVMLGATITGAMAYDLSDYPAPFVSGGGYNMLPVYGDTSMGDDIAGAWDILGGMVSEAVTPGTTTKTKIIGGVSEEITLGTPVNEEIDELDDRDISGLQDTFIYVDNNEIDVHDEIIIGDKLSVETSLTSDLDYEENIVLEIGRDGLVYNYEFDDEVWINETSISDPIDIMFLGEKLKIIGQQSSNSLIVNRATDYWVEIGEKVTADGKIVELINVGQTAIVVKIEGVIGTVYQYQTKTINGMKVTLNEVFYRTQLEESSASISVGKDSYVKIKDKEAYFGQDEDEPEWTWDLSGINNPKPNIAIAYDLVRNSYDDNVVGVNECYTFPREYFSVCLDETNGNYVNYELGEESDELVFESDDDEGFKIDGNKYSDKILIGSDGIVSWLSYDDGDEWVNVTEGVMFNNDEADIELLNSGTQITIYSPLKNDNITLGYDLTSSPIKLNNLNWTTRDIGDDDETLLTKYGIWINNPENNLEDNSLDIDIPENQHFGIVSISGAGTVISGGETSFVSDMPPPMVKASEVSNPEASNLLIIGGPVVNSMAARFIGSDWAYKPGEAIIELKENGVNVALVVAGTDAVDTRRAARVLRDYKTYAYDLTGMAVKVTGTSPAFTDTVVEAATTIQEETTDEEEEATDEENEEEEV